ncbi:tyrosine-type recombinase/integrase [Burkholderia pseudomultivorans]|uniref:Tyrosine recombinase XerD n=1 Tax=Burkholderia pseudomultivorans TaxID=1207504 RepID=A0ABU2E1Z5_9BURK|nr:tyrosine-type recombinase/integrase [Burkholderia pseudomultivorans]MDR8727798.1 Tyrosine recombinase XerD [Burkholderia pseudomultivorans]MDR8735762.1 Tyrosine recombinase XerD [Burkholderia pseudomultivorans]MDR8742700.1 Tyrosine recombinase XerD [Burkholderia pseudomultivorans]MDR8753875.1 Tyrosine recombinase XerD [Burkholderia pseudomultivorans]MDR8779098.1 Tyrosine recombinase XerD [Burkholderia pseudomultivorans]
MSLPSSAAPSARPEEKDLFDRGASDWILSPEAAFDAWLAMQDYRRSSADVYRAQWGAFLTWLRAHQKNLATVDTASIAHFVGELPIKKTQRMRYLRLIERVLDHIRRTELASTNPARFIAQDGEANWRKARDNEPTGFLTPAERAKLLAYLFSPIGVSGAAYWKERRDRALVAAFLGGGIKTGEAKVLTISCINTSGTSLQIPSTHPDFARETHLASFAIALFDAWLLERKRQEIPGDLVFPASHTGRPMHKATMLRAIDAIVESAGLSSSRTARTSPQTLRNTYAAELFENDVPPERVGKWLGFMQPISSNRLHRAWKNWRDDMIEGDATDHDETH